MSKSPFPGMDPFIEAAGLWENFHSLLIAEMQRALAATVPERYAVRAGERSYLVLGEGPDSKAPFQPDLAVVAPRTGSDSEAENIESAGHLLAEVGPVVMSSLPATEHRESFFEIFELVPERRLVTVIELLSPSNKRLKTRGWRVFQRKREVLLAGTANYVEIDLLRRGTRPYMAERAYYVLVARQFESPKCLVWPAGSLTRLPRIPIPLFAPDPDVVLDLQPLVDEVYSRSRYDVDIHYADTAVLAGLTDAERRFLADSSAPRGAS